ncbi:hypothetical protein N7373_18025 [Achromobacter mucicolens]|uniref:hypothetical protein n=1 Tax=Achromobacter mucicolens TaxID=1389922 RepID=UPI002448FEB1|nr:hypothetical protein [Achromobacter mucicolens]MDH0093355.1 hypothetical protein [Achromobacter mucicolens]
MPARTPDPGIPTLTHRAEPSFHDPADDDADTPLLTELADEAGPVYENDPYEHDPFPVLTDVADADELPELPISRASEHRALPAAAPSPATAPAPPSLLPDSTVLAARLQAEVEQLMRQALADAVTQLQARMDAELPAIVSRVLNEVRRG